MINAARSVALCVLLLLLTTTRARATEEEAKAFSEKGKADYALGHFAEAADDYEAAFKAAPTPALLYNAAQSHRLAGHKERALQLYQSYLRVYGREGSNRKEAEHHIANLTRALEEEKRAATAPPTSMATEPETPVAPVAPPTLPPAPAAAPAAAPRATVAEAPPPSPSAVPAAPEPAAAPATLVATPAPATVAERPLTSRPWFWIAVGGGVAAAAIITVVAISAGHTTLPSPSAGTIPGN
jgi:tetratricopeptide (TPR) repeat protein